jgi:hypothetical protein
MKLTIEAVQQAAKQTGLNPDEQLRLIETLSDMTAGEDEKEPTPRIKKQFVILASRQSLTTEGAAPVGWVCQIAESDSPETVYDRVKRASDVFNCTKKGRLTPVQTMGEACENVKAGILKGEGVWVKTKTPVYLIIADNELPDAPSVLHGNKGEDSDDE